MPGAPRSAAVFRDLMEASRGIDPNGTDEGGLGSATSPEREAEIKSRRRPAPGQLPRNDGRTLICSTAPLARRQAAHLLCRRHRHEGPRGGARRKRWKNHGWPRAVINGVKEPDLSSRTTICASCSSTRRFFGTVRTRTPQAMLGQTRRRLPVGEGGSALFEQRRAGRAGKRQILRGGGEFRGRGAPGRSRIVRKKPRRHGPSGPQPMSPASSFDISDMKAPRDGGRGRPARTSPRCWNPCLPPSSSTTATTSSSSPTASCRTRCRPLVAGMASLGPQLPRGAGAGTFGRLFPPERRSRNRQAL